MEWDWNFVWQIMPTMIEGVKITILATLLGAALAAVVLLRWLEHRYGRIER